MNIYRIAIFIFLVQEGITLLSLAHYPLACNASGACIYFEASTIQGTTMADIIKGNVESGIYKTTQIEANIQADAWTSTGIYITMASSIVYGSIFGISSIILFFFGYSLLSGTIAVIMQALVYLFYISMILDGIKAFGKGDV